MFYHAHLQSRFPRDDGFYEIPRPTFLQELTWVDGWPVFSGGRPALQERMPNVIRADGS